MGYHILDYDIELVSEFGLCYKNKLPKELQRRLFTRKQWLEKGFVLKEGLENIQCILRRIIEIELFII